MGSSILQKHEPHHRDDHEEPGQDADADEDNVAGVLALDFAGVHCSPVPLLGNYQVFCLAEPGWVRAGDEGHRGFLPLWLTLHLVLVDVLLVAHRKIDVEGADNDRCVVAFLQDKGRGSLGICAAHFHRGLEGSWP